MPSSQGFSSVWRRATDLAQYLLPELNFITIHYLYFIITSLITALIFWGSATPFGSLSFTDALFLTSSAMTEAGLNTVNLSTLNTWQQFMLFALIMLGSTIFVSIFVILIRLRAFDREFKRTIEERRAHRQRMRANSRGSRSSNRRGSNRSDLTLATVEELRRARTSRAPPEEAIEDIQSEETEDHAAEKKREASPDDPGADPRVDTGLRSPQTIRFSLAPVPRSTNEALNSPMPLRRINTGGSLPDTRPASRKSFFSFNGVGATASANFEPRLSTAQLPAEVEEDAADGQTPRRPLSSSGHNSIMFRMSIRERHELGGREYYAIQFLSVLVPLYFVLFQLLGSVACGAWIAIYRNSTARDNGINPWWLGAFNAVSAFNNSGMSLLDANMTAFQDSTFLLLSMGLFILAGNTAFPIFLRLAIWTMWKLLPDGEYWHYERDTLRFLLDHPRRCYTNLFPSKHTWWLSLTLITLNGIDWAMFEILNIGNAAITSLRDGVEALDGLFQALAVRSGGFYVVPIASTRISLQVLYVVMMFISAYPVAITLRSSNIYEQRSLGIYAEDVEEQRDAVKAGDAPRGPRAPADSPPSLLHSLSWVVQARTREETTIFLRQQLRAQLSHDAWWLALAVFLISIIENASFEANPAVFSLFNILFEVVSGYACCGISVGVPWAAYSFCGEWHALSKLIMVAVMIRGRHRGLPVAIDGAVQLPGRSAWDAEEEDARLRSERAPAASD